MTTLTLYPDPDRSRVQVFVRDLGADAPATVYRVVNGTGTPVRGAVSITGDTIVDDYECPLDVLVRYEVAPDEPSAPITAEASTTLDGSVIGVPVLVHPTDPTRNLPVTLVDDTPVEAASPGTVHRVVGRRLPLVTFTIRNDVRREVRAWLPYADLVKLWHTVDDGSPLLVKAPAGCAITDGWRWPETVRVGKRGQDPRGVRGVDVTLDTVDVDTPTGRLTADPVNSWAAVVEYVGTWADVNSTYATWADVRLAVFP